MPKVSVLIPSYNHARFLPATLESVFQQTFSDYEVVVVDDGSVDDSVAILQSYGERVRLYVQQNRGTYSTLNRCVAESRGEYLAILNSDDLWMPTKLEKQVALLEANPQLGLVHTGGHFIDAAGQVLPGNPLGFEWPRTPTGNIIEALVRCNKIIASSVLIRRECFERLGGFREDLYGSGDWEMWFRVALEYDIGYIDEPLTMYRVHGANASFQHMRVYEDDVKVRTGTIHACESRLWQRATDRRAMRLALAHSYACMGTEYALLGDRRNARRAYLRSLRLYPLRFKSLLRLGLTFLPLKPPL
ncbi:MAG: glycosyltransferase [Fimbriimonadales bacterium]|nr:glycosyltransferase [Fimbriimonadales bacterium]